MTVVVDIQRASKADEDPTDAELESWVNAALNAPGHGGRGELTVRLVSFDEMALLNARYRHRDGATNVLSFPADGHETLDPPLLGDIVICSEIVRHEAHAQGKTPRAHWAHLVVHGVLHLLGYDHQAAEEAQRMEALETQLLEGLAFPAPYAVEGGADALAAP